MDELRALLYRNQIIRNIIQFLSFTKKKLNYCTYIKTGVTESFWIIYPLNKSI